jgi:tyrosyl-tRNA synthetase
MLHEATPGLAARLSSGRPIAGYTGFDPSADSLHIGNLVPIFGLLHLQRRGGRPVAVVGGATGMIGDPSGRSAERNLLDRPTIERNVSAIRAQLGRFLDFSPGPGQAIMVNNLDWLGGISLIDFLRETGKHFTVPYMLAKDSVQLRLDRGLSFTEFSYMLLQARDFAHLYQTLGVEMQMGGADQWGNITAGLELIRRTLGSDAGDGAPAGGDAVREPAFALSYPLLLSPSGAKFGKSEAGESVWLDAARTSPFAFYQHWINTDDRDVGVYLRWFTLLDAAVIAELEVAVAQRPEGREAQRTLAADVTARVHGERAAGEAADVSRALFQPEPIHDPARLAAIHAALGGGVLGSDVVAAGSAAILVEAGMAPSRSEGRRLIAGGAVTINGVRQTDPIAVPAPIGGEWFEIRVGKRRREVRRLAG